MIRRTHWIRYSGRKRAPALAALGAAVALMCPASLEAATDGHLLYANHGNLMSVPARGGAPQALARVPANTLDLASSRDGKRVVLISNRKLPSPSRGSIRSIHLFRPGHGVQLVRRYRSTSPLDVAISPDGRWIAFGQEGEI